MIRIGHRGAAGWEPQNTELSFKKAIDLKCDFIETDLHICKSGEIVLFHDARIDSFTNGSGYISELSITELKKFDFGKGQSIVQLEDLLKLAEGKVKLNLELKSRGTGIAAAEILKKTLNETSWKASDFCVSSFNHPELLTFHERLPDVPVGLLIKSILMNTTEYMDSLNIDLLVSSLEFLTPELVEEIHEAGKRVFVYTVNYEEDITEMISLKVDGIVSNFPERIPKSRLQNRKCGRLQNREAE